MVGGCPPNLESDTRFCQLSFTILLHYRSVYRFPAFEDGPPEFSRHDLAPAYCYGLGVGLLDWLAVCAAPADE